MLLIVHTAAPTIDSSNITHANLTHPHRRSPTPAVPAVVGTAFSITMKDPHGSTNEMKNAMLEPMKDHTTATPLTATAPT